MRETGVTKEFEGLLEYLKQNRGFDFTGYKSASVMRRVQKRMQSVGQNDYESYVDYLEVHPDEFAQLFNTILINVTDFFRDMSYWEFLMSDILPHIVATKGKEEPIRVWSAGCASGEEPYSLAILLAETLGIEAYQQRVKIYATDLDEEVLVQARQATYSAKAVANLPARYREKYFEQAGTNYVFTKDLRRTVIFGRHNLIQDAPISRVDLLTCRNTLMYFNSETQSRILARFHFSLNDTGYLFLGKAEMLFMHTGSFLPVDLRRRIFTKVPRGNLRDRLIIMAQTGNDDAASRLSNHMRMREVAFDMGTSAQLVTDAAGFLLMANEYARNLFKLTVRDLGRPLQDLEVSYRPVELRSCIEVAHADHRTYAVKEVEWLAGPDGPLYLDLAVLPLEDLDGVTLGTLISFTDVTRSRQLQDELLDTNQELEAAYEELQSTSEELETTNEELQSTNEELETMNEELQSTNEEMETMNEELQSTNEEMQTINDELRIRSDELNQVNAFMASVLASLRGGVVVVDRDLYVRSWNHRTEDMWGLRGEETRGEHFLNLEIGLPVEALKSPIRTCLTGERNFQEITLDAINRKGKSFRCKVTCTPLLGTTKEPQGVILMMEDVEG